ncbi:FAD-dependent oxidoreductase [Helicobacter trogontum]|uniref:FAD-dependent oxidoreductase n=2 Tax=Helicobacter trogontum TaxID=50960 RepID=A0A099VLB6_9HELI|nr:FAD-dependent oxidoreductase [Helicobacter trogontum]MDY5184589.1 FAD-dependent oxidoreductase [Helicobacter trogontum]TLD81452.1 FAD-dependent oxidoreductase [Helicobacter trogontum]TLD98087.1 FAD-dependent oxidoreductase [Helicobacter trogontum]
MYDCVIIGGGFYGCNIALYLCQYYKKVLLIERENGLLKRASLNNQARVHGGYHYPRSLLTAFSSLKNFQYFCENFQDAIKSDFEKYYALSSIGSKCNANQFYHIFKNMNAPIDVAPPHVKALFDKNLISEVFSVREYVFNSDILREILSSKLKKAHCEVTLNTKVHYVKSAMTGVEIGLSNDTKIYAHRVFNCTYAGLNELLLHSELPPLNLKAEITEMALVEIPKILHNISVTVMDGAFFSFMPFPTKNLYTLSHVRYTPHMSFMDKGNLDNYQNLEQYSKDSRFMYMIYDAKRYMPILNECIYKDSIFEIKIVSIKNEQDDGRPIIFTKDYGIKNFYNVLGGKIDNIYDILNHIKGSIFQ